MNNCSIGTFALRKPRDLKLDYKLEMHQILQIPTTDTTSGKADLNVCVRK